jgi:glycosyltransferase involved in cell wall biosynthesis
MQKSLEFEDVGVIIPAFNEESRISSCLSSLLENFKYIYVIDDGSSDSTFETVKDFDVHLIRHPINLGQGAALQTGLTSALKNSQLNYFLTFDADGQHSIDDALAMSEAIIRTGVEIVLGSRYLSKTLRSKMPLKKKFVLRAAIIFTRFDSGLKVTDTHNGLRIMTRKFAESLTINQNGMAHASEILNHVSNSKVNWMEIPVTLKYTSELNKKGQSVLNAINIITEMSRR